MDTVASVPEDGEKIIEIQLERLRTFRNHPFKVRMDQEMIRLSASVEKYGIMVFMRLSPDTEERQLLKSLVTGRCRSLLESCQMMKQ